MLAGGPGSSAATARSTSYSRQTGSPVSPLPDVTPSQTGKGDCKPRNIVFPPLTKSNVYHEPTYIYVCILHNYRKGRQRL